MQKLFLVDAYALIYRSYYAFINRPMRNSEGLNTSAVFGFVKFLNELIKREQPHYLGVAFDPGGLNFRHGLYSDYKANREATPEDIKLAVPYIKRIIEAMRIPCLEMPGYEADDVIGTLSQKAAAAGFEVFMVTPDKDYGQLIRPTVYMYKPAKGGEGIDIVGCDKIREHYGIDDPCLVTDILALWGDASDNIPGVPGIGEKSAVKLVCQFGSVENLLENTDKLSGKQKENIIANREQILLSKELATIRLDVPIEFDPQTLVMEEPDVDALSEHYKELGFRSFLQELQGGGRYVHANSAPQNTAAQQPVQHDLFGMPVAGTASAAAKSATFMAEPGTQGDLFDAPAYQSIEDTPHRYHTVRDMDAIDRLCATLSAAGKFCFDTETTGFDPITSQLVGISFAVKPFEAWYIPCDRSNIAEVSARLRPLFADENIAKIGQNIKFDIMVLRTAGIETRGRLYDTMIIHYLLDPESRHGMDHLARTYLNYSPVPIESLIGRGAKQLTMDMVSVDKVAAYAAEDADVTIRLWEELWPRLREQGLEGLYASMEEPLINVLADMEMTGIKIDSEALASTGAVLNAELEGLEDSIRELAGEPAMNVNSAKQLGDVLFDKLKIDSNPRRTKTKQYRTDEEYLQMLYDKHPIIALILEYRGLRKLLSTYVEALPQLVNPVTGRIHTSFNQAVTATGRLSSTNPNLQNIPIRDERGREIRKAFIPTDSDHLLLSADYSQVELRLMAHLSGDRNMLDAFAAGEDIHTATAAKLFHVDDKDVTREMRRKAKTANFGIIYGISAFGLGQRLNIPRTEAKDIIDGYFAAYPDIKRYMENIVEEARENGYVTTLFGRKRMLPDIRSGNAVVRGLAERNAINAPIQGGAADIMKLAMIAVHREIKERGFKSKMILQVHDEIVIDLLRSEESEVRELVVRCMEGAAKLNVELLAECGIGENWIEAH